MAAKKGGILVDVNARRRRIRSSARTACIRRKKAISGSPELFLDAMKSVYESIPPRFRGSSWGAHDGCGRRALLRGSSGGQKPCRAELLRGPRSPALVPCDRGGFEAFSTSTYVVDLALSLEHRRCRRSVERADRGARSPAVRKAPRRSMSVRQHVHAARSMRRSSALRCRSGSSPAVPARSGTWHRDRPCASAMRRHGSGQDRCRVCRRREAVRPQSAHRSRPASSRPSGERHRRQGGLHAPTMPDCRRAGSGTSRIQHPRKPRSPPPTRDSPARAVERGQPAVSIHGGS